jgi:hypothetical protein
MEGPMTVSLAPLAKVGILTAMKIPQLLLVGWSCLLLYLILYVSSAGGQSSPIFPAPRDLGDPAVWGRGIQRTMTLLATSTPDHRNTVKIFFYARNFRNCMDLAARWPSPAASGRW